MKRKLFAMLLCGLAIILLMGAGVDPMIQAVQAADRAQEERSDAPAQEPANQIVDQPQDEQNAPNQPEPELDRILLVNGQPVPRSVGRMTVGGETYVSLKAMAEQLDPSIAVEWNADTRTVTLTTETLSLSAQTGKLYLKANGRYLYMPEGVQLIDGVMMVSLDALAKAFDATTGWDGENGTFTVTTGSGAILPGEQFY
ncbi:MAG: copper amine oxidase N-terminal domain-containing protein, partial [Oscillospiraceae bacterium]|nr:copper amine oxidase N-terminal domain-containing protein [Oscillospiraceae bacterium]